MAADFRALRSSSERIVAALLAGAVLLVFEIRFEHRQALGETSWAWVPLVYGSALVALGLVALARWERGGRRLAAVLFGAAVLVGAAGIWFHSAGHPLRGAFAMISAWRLPPGENGGIKIGAAPPLFAPGAFCGLGLIGLIACLHDAERDVR